MVPAGKRKAPLYRRGDARALHPARQGRRATPGEGRVFPVETALARASATPACAGGTFSSAVASLPWLRPHRELVAARFGEVEAAATREGESRLGDGAAGGFHGAQRRLRVVAVEHDERAAGFRACGQACAVEAAVQALAGERDVVGAVVLEGPAEGVAEEPLRRLQVAGRVFDVVDLFVPGHGGLRGRGVATGAGREQGWAAVGNHGAARRGLPWRSTALAACGGAAPVVRVPAGACQAWGSAHGPWRTNPARRGPRGDRAGTGAARDSNRRHSGRGRGTDTTSLQGDQE